ncbi:hypothetical protein ACE38W_02510 [Chitinophaga sp. Hz27]|uniref:hypothetical protein n=1 Tax=Chitinophaga sp. Hz27 TaxID=3347169 RepID=UPI0035DB3653
MTAIATIKNYLDRLSLKFKDLTIKYAFDASIEAHVVELTPNEIYDNNKELMEHWVPFSLDFDSRYKDPIVFISSDSTLRVAHPELKWSNGKRLRRSSRSSICGNQSLMQPAIDRGYDTDITALPSEISACSFLTQHLNALALKYKYVSIKYAFDKDRDMYLVELTPASIYYSNDELRADWIALSFKFGTRYNEDITFITSDSPLYIAKPVREWNTRQYHYNLPPLLAPTKQILAPNCFIIDAANTSHSTHNV